MRWFNIMLALGLATSSAPAVSKAAQTFADKVVAAKRSLNESADKAFIEIWPGFQSKADQLGISATGARAFAQWSVLGYSLGICEAHASAADLATWYSRFDAIDVGGGEFANELRASNRARGEETLANGRQSTVLAELTKQEKAQLCRVELEAVRQLLAGK